MNVFKKCAFAIFLSFLSLFPIGRLEALAPRSSTSSDPRLGLPNNESIVFAGGSIGDFEILRETIRTALRKSSDFLIEHPHLLINYREVEPLGYAELRQRIARLLGISSPASEVLITTSSRTPYYIILNRLIKPSSTVFVQQPTYPDFLDALEIARKAKSLNIVAFTKMEEILPQLSEGFWVYLNSNFHNPTGQSLSEMQKAALAAKVEETGSFVIEDNPSDLIFFGETPPKRVFDFAPNSTLYINSFSKILAPNLRIGFVIGAQQAIRSISDEKRILQGGTSISDQLTAYFALETPEYLNELREKVLKKRDLAIRLLGKYFQESEGVQWNTPDGGIYINLQFPKSVDMNILLGIAKETYHLELEKDSKYYLDKQTRNTTRINFALNPLPILEEGIRRLSFAFQEAKTRSAGGTSLRLMDTSV